MKTHAGMIWLIKSLKQKKICQFLPSLATERKPKVYPLARIQNCSGVKIESICRLQFHCDSYVAISL